MKSTKDLLHQIHDPNLSFDERAQLRCRLAKQLEGQAWEVDSTSDGAVALEKISADTHYDLLLLDYLVPNINGIELVHRARRMPHRSRIPIIVLAGTPVGAAALEAGASAFLQKPKDVPALVATITRLFESEGGPTQER